MAVIGRPRSCHCGECAKCKHSARTRAAYQAMSMDERRAQIARRDKERVAVNEAKRFQRNKQKRMALSQEWAEKNRDRRREISRGWEERNPEKRAAQAKVSWAIRSGALVRQPCEVCGAAKVEAHHDDYSKPLDVRWLCSEHHGETRRKRQVAA